MCSRVQVSVDRSNFDTDDIARFVHLPRVEPVRSGFFVVVRRAGTGFRMRSTGSIS